MMRSRICGYVARERRSPPRAEAGVKFFGASNFQLAALTRVGQLCSLSVKYCTTVESSTLPATRDKCGVQRSSVLPPSVCRSRMGGPLVLPVVGRAARGAPGVPVETCVERRIKSKSKTARPRADARGSSMHHGVIAHISSRRGCWSYDHTTSHDSCSSHIYSHTPKPGLARTLATATRARPGRGTRAPSGGWRGCRVQWRLGRVGPAAG